MKLNFIGKEPTNVVSIWSWKHPELAMYDPNREDELEWAAQQMYQKLYGNKDKTIKHSLRIDQSLKVLLFQELSKKLKLSKPTERFFLFFH